MKNPAIALGAGAAALALMASSKKKGASKSVPAWFKTYETSDIVVEPDGSRVYVGIDWPYKVLIPTLNTFEDTPINAVDKLYAYARVIERTKFKTPDGKSISWKQIPDTDQVEQLRSAIKQAAEAYIEARSKNISKVMLGHYRKIMAQYTCELPESKDYLPPSCMVSIALGKI